VDVEIGMMLTTPRDGNVSGTAMPGLQPISSILNRVIDDSGALVTSSTANWLFKITCTTGKTSADATSAKGLAVRASSLIRV